MLKKQRRANIVPPPWLHPAALADIIHQETVVDPEAFSPPPPPPARSDGRGTARQPFAAATASAAGGPVLSPPFLPACTANAPAGYLPYHWLELAETLLAHAADDVPGAPEVRTLLRDLQEVRAAKLRGSTAQLEGGGGVVGLRGVGAMELAESRAFLLAVVDGVRKLGASAEATRREDEDEQNDDDDDNGPGRRGATGSGDDSDEEMGF